MKFALPTHPEVFLKPGSSLCSAVDTVELPRIAGDQIDAEVELAVVIGKDCKNVNKADALSFVLGYTVANDLTARDVQKRGSQWSYCKGFDGFCPLGPALVSAKAVPDPSVLQVSTTLNGQTMQSQVASDMIFTIPEIIEYLSAVSFIVDLLTQLTPRLGEHVATRYCYTYWNASRNWGKQDTPSVFERGRRAPCFDQPWSWHIGEFAGGGKVVATSTPRFKVAHKLFPSVEV
jgi:hypothetical protein